MRDCRGAQIDSCTPNLECFMNDNYNSSMSAVVAIYAINLSLGAMALCTGARRHEPAHRVQLWVCRPPAVQALKAA